MLLKRLPRRDPERIGPAFMRQMGLYASPKGILWIPAEERAGYFPVQSRYFHAQATKQLGRLYDGLRPTRRFALFLGEPNGFDPSHFEYSNAIGTISQLRHVSRLLFEEGFDPGDYVKAIIHSGAKPEYAQELRNSGARIVEVSETDRTLVDRLGNQIRCNGNKISPRPRIEIVAGYNNRRTV